MAYNSTTGIITAPVSIYDVMQCFGSGRNDLGDLIANVSINMWAKFKPVRSYQSGLLDTVSQLSNGVWNNALSSQWWRDTVNAVGLRIGYGINPIRRTSLADLFQVYQAGTQWSHIRPNGVGFGGSIYPYRLLDFHQYNNKAPQPLGSISAPSSLILTTGEAWSIVAIEAIERAMKNE